MIATRRIFGTLMMAAVAASLTARIAAAQSVRLSVVDAVRDVPLGGVIATIINDGNTTIVEGLVSASGQRTLAVPLPGRYRIRVRRVGFRPFVSDPIVLAAGEVRSVVLRVPPERVMLPPVRTAARTECRQGGALDEATTIALTEVRTALASASLAWKDQVDPIVSTAIERRLTLGGRRINERRTAKGELYRPPFVSDKAHILHRLGYVRQESPDGERTFLLPSADVLLSDAFAEVHCFTLVEDPKDGNRVGVRFEPLTSQRLPDVTGTMWLSRETSAPTTIEFRFTGVTYDAPTSGATGAISLVSLDSGVWIINEWAIRMPAFTRWRGTDRIEQTGWVEIGGEALPLRSMPKPSTAMGASRQTRATASTR